MGAEDPVQREDTSVTISRRVPLSVIPVTAFGKYTLIGKLGHGGMAEVFLSYVAGPAGFRKLCVIKSLHAHLEEEPGFLDMFLDEARLAARLNHPNVVQSYEVGEVNGGHFIAMEYLEGQGLDRVRQRCIRSGTRLPPELCAHIVVDALEGLHYAHTLKDFDETDLGVIHRDISPQNVFITYEGSVKLLDFGIAKASTHVVETRTNVIKGKFAYIAPEQARGEDIDLRADIWSMGVVLWETLTSKRLFKGPNDVATLSEALTGDIKQLSDVVDDIPPRLAEITHKALTRDVDERYSTASEFKTDLKKFLIKEYPATSREDVSTFVRGLFGDVIKQNKKVLKVCLSDATAEHGLTTGEYRLITQTANGELSLGGTPTPSSTQSGVALASTSSPGMSPISGPELTPQSFSGLSHAPGEPRSRSRLLLLLLLLLFAVVGVGFALWWNQNQTVAPVAVAPVAVDEPQSPPPAPRTQVSLTSSPSGAEVLYGGVTLGETPLAHELDRLPVGAEASFVFRLDGRDDMTVSSPLRRDRVRVHADFVEASEPQADAGTEETPTVVATPTPTKVPMIRRPRFPRNPRPRPSEPPPVEVVPDQGNQQASRVDPPENGTGGTRGQEPRRPPERPIGIILDDNPRTSIPIID